jgi:hypothetical protein
MLLQCIAFAAALLLPPLEPLQAALSACARGAPGGCGGLTAELAAQFGGTSAEDRRLGAALAASLVRIVERPTPSLQPAVRTCASGACGDLAWVTRQLFTGGDAIVDGSRLRPLGRALAAALTESQETVCASQ